MTARATAEIHLADGSGERRGEPISCGMPWPRGVLLDAADVEIRDRSGNVVPLQSQVLDRWSDGSVRWLLLDWRADAPGGSPYVTGIRRSEAPAVQLDRPAILARSSSGGWRVSTGRLEAELAIGRGLLLRRVESSAVALEEGQVWLEARDEQGHVHHASISTIEIEALGPLRVAVRGRGALIDTDGRALANLVTRVELFADSPVLRFEVTVHNPRAAGHPGGRWSLGSAGSVYFESLTFGLAFRDAEEVSCSLRCGERCDARALPLELYQDSSG